MPNDALKRALELADAWKEQQKLSDEQQALNTHFDRATPHQLIKMWDTGLNLTGKKLSSFELAALIEQWVKVFGSMPPDDDDLDEMVAEEAAASLTSVPLPADDTMLSMKDVVRITGLSKSTIKRMVLDHRFPQAVRLSPRRLGWPARDVKAWLSALDEQKTKTRH